jgi:hypothetical protein
MPIADLTDRLERMYNGVRIYQWGALVFFEEELIDM